MSDLPLADGETPTPDSKGRTPPGEPSQPTDSADRGREAGGAAFAGEGSSGAESSGSESASDDVGLAEAAPRAGGILSGIAGWARGLVTPRDAEPDASSSEAEALAANSLQSASDGSGRSSRREPLLLQVGHVPSACHVYPTEELSFLTRLRTLAPLRRLTLEVSLPIAVQVVDTDQPRGVDRPDMIVGADENLLRWIVDDDLAEPTELHFGVTIVAPNVDMLGPDPAGVSRHSVILSRARALAVAVGNQGSEDEREWSAVEVRGRGRYLSHLPAVFERDVIMSRFLMAFESFWAPLEQQVNTIDAYFDPGLMSLPMLNWLADRMDLEIDDEWDEAVQRRMMASAVRLFRKRGTRDGLQELLEVYTGGEVTIVERRAENFKLGRTTRLGSAVALGAANQPHTFSVYLKLPSVRTARPEAAQQLRDLRRQRITKLIDSERPAHVRYTLDIVEQ
ncbi:MAG: phage tail protein [Caldilineaceae bacterium]